MARLFADENFPVEVARLLRQRGHDVTVMQEAGMANRGIPDPEILALATAQGRAVLTINRRDFIRLHRRDPDHAGIVVCTENHDEEELASCIDAALKAQPELLGKLIRVYRLAGR